MEEMVLEKTAVMEKQGVGERLLRELIKSPKFKASLGIFLSELDASTARGMIRTFMWEDVETFMGSVAVLPTVVNYSVQALHELIIQLNNFPPAVLLAFLSQLVDKIDFEVMEEAVGELKLLLEKLNPVIDSLKDASSGVLAQVGTTE
ncbi:MAG: hypothetical protein A2V52_01560 [Actinobacteria bacterium RBG_19FT_COMBO_54_7]|uniref:Uncharacterized protein n=1 Tax=Candidatus Solincola sediminis TaxID=1797199 RepID=A0A1F2WT70_9ACTN|nr:MAG: hypothetical protein A2W01_02885 [Candidatus Solincola sediminis]OFW60098.1 MAG: hypothetical protein A2Y75_02085 [Candidatus Solincola sediminis]OFW69488.1 MAG: hypothetical protein A2V52_01560 [Actinobacteria bacterium RBG_19FT_COMBO_54_7]